MKRMLRIVAVLIVLAAAGFWLAAGANRGWTKDKMEKKTLDEVTGIEGITYEKKFVPGLDFLGAAAIGGGFLTGISFLLRNKNKPQPSN
jgi:hypothetical protein